MLKVKNEIGLVDQARAKLLELIARVPFISVSGQVVESASGAAGGWRPDLSVSIDAGGASWQLVCDVKRDAQPRHVRGAALVLKDYVERAGSVAGNGQRYPILIAPFISAASAGICNELGVGYVDLAGNCRLAFDGVYIEKSTVENPFRSRRVQRSMFSPKSARLLRVLLAEPFRTWRVTELSERCQVSLGQVSNLRQRLLDEEWAVADRTGMHLSKPRELLEAWSSVYRLDLAHSEAAYTLLHGESLEKALRALLAEADRGKHAVLASYSAGQWIAPFARTASAYFYADENGETIIREHLHLEPAGKGANVSIMRPKDEGVFLDRIEAASGIWCTSPIQTYLDLAAGGLRGVEAAEHLFNERIARTWKLTK
ncbi:MAG: hypothetical protein HY749_22330 [Gammaproteobacteria bacterium]|nr:hypothetical protein [Gammaproteobacteria bacterium]MBI5616083.1 hypothetical protein [Gammaproteobacteria bacterium]